MDSSVFQGASVCLTLSPICSDGSDAEASESDGKFRQGKIAGPLNFALTRDMAQRAACFFSSPPPAPFSPSSDATDPQLCQTVPLTVSDYASFQDTTTAHLQARLQLKPLASQPVFKNNAAQTAAPEPPPQPPVDPYAVSRHCVETAALQPIFISAPKGRLLSGGLPTLTACDDRPGAEVSNGIPAKRSQGGDKVFLIGDSSSVFPPWRQASACADSLHRRLFELRRETALLREKVFVWGEAPTDPYDTPPASTEGTALPSLFNGPVLLPPPPAVLDINGGHIAPPRFTLSASPLRAKSDTDTQPPPPPPTATGSPSTGFEGDGIVLSCFSGGAARLCEGEASQHLARRRPKNKTWRVTPHAPSGLQSRAWLILRRTCYRCRRKGHEASACPENASASA